MTSTTIPPPSFFFRRAPRRPPRQAMPFALEIEYGRALTAIMRSIYVETTPGFLERFERFRLDARSRDVDAEKERQRIRIEDKARRAAQTIASKVDRFNARAVSTQIQTATGVDLVGRTDLPNRERIIRAFVRENVDLIKSIPDRYFDRVTAIIADGYARGERREVIARRLQERLGVAEFNARRIAGDQVNKLNGRLTQERQTAVGIDAYRWITARDDKVRPAHADNEGRLFLWSDPPLGTGHPGQAINCRCLAEPDTTALFRR